ncbi:MAG: SH3 domain-containing protein, partial [Burkholderiales bacterium]|nr:SH3 domain-containing protein [Phycisphaerae bacterium]
MHRTAAILGLSLGSFVFSITYLAPSAALAQAEAPDAEMEKYQFSGIVNADNVYVRSGPSENDYPVVKLNKGGTVVVVGTKFDWLKVLPPENTFCLVGKAWVEKRADGTVGRVHDDATNVNVRIASSLNNMITKVAMQMKSGDDVKILGEQDEYFKVAPPAGTFMYVHKKFIDPVKRVEVINDNGTLQVKALETGLIATPANTGTTTDIQTPTAPTNPPTKEPETPLAGGPTTAPAAPVASADEAAFDVLDARFEAASRLPLEEQPVDELLASYQKVISDKKVPESMLRIAEFRLKGLNVRRDARAQYLETRKVRDDLANRAKPIEAEGQEIDQRIKDAQVQQFTAVGTLRQSAVPYGGRTLYRLTDPTTGRTVVYINTADANVIRYEGLFVGVRGEVTDDPARRLRFIVPTETTQIDPALLIKGSITSKLVPA